MVISVFDPFFVKSDRLLERQLADAHTRIHEMIAEIDRHDELIADLQRRIQELEQVRSTQP